MRQASGVSSAYAAGAVSTAIRTANTIASRRNMRIIGTLEVGAPLHRSDRAGNVNTPSRRWPGRDTTTGHHRRWETGYRARTPGRRPLGRGGRAWPPSGTRGRPQHRGRRSRARASSPRPRPWRPTSWCWPCRSPSCPRSIVAVVGRDRGGRHEPLAPGRRGQPRDRVGAVEQPLGAVAESGDAPGEVAQPSRLPRPRAGRRPAGDPERRGLAAASDDAAARAAVAGLIDDLGFDPVEVPFSASRLLEGDGPVFGRWEDAPGLRRLLDSTWAALSGCTALGCTAFGDAPTLER